MSDEWTQPDAPPAPLFTGKKERDLVKKVNDELIEKIIGQQVLYYPIDIENTNFNELYGEAIEKSFLPPVRVYALVELNEFGTKYSDNIGLDKEAKITVNFHKRRLEEDQNLYVREGDFILYGQTFYEIVILNEPRQLFGQIDNRFEISAICVKAREGLFNAD
jgi:hypothetical protein|tara:strand:+ start:9914 stop:10402 length:489 start_codon:yes stop_codon:yes gene_type:complete